MARKTKPPDLKLVPKVEDILPESLRVSALESPAQARIGIDHLSGSVRPARRAGDW